MVNGPPTARKPNFLGCEADKVNGVAACSSLPP
jgi:hypothetical protein